MKSFLSGQRRLTLVIGALGLLVADLLSWVICLSFLGLLDKQGAVTLLLVWIGWVGLVKSVYVHRLPFWEDLRLTIKWLICGIGGLYAVAPLLGASTPWSELSLALAPMLILVIPLFRALTRWVLIQVGYWYRPAVIFGVQENAEQAALAILGEKALGYRVEAFVRMPELNHVQPAAGLCAAVIEASLTKQSLAQFKKYNCIIALEADHSEVRDTLIQVLTSLGVKNVHVIPAMRGVPLFSLKAVQFFSHELLMVQLSNQLARPELRILKRAVDVIGSAILLILLSPLFLYLIYKIKRDGGSPFYVHTRVGRNGQPFKCYKFRTMVMGADGLLEDLLRRDPVAKAEWDKDFKLKDDPRINAIGHFLRRTSLDELPQLWNVLNGEMSLVGPRPVVSDELQRYAENTAYYLMVRPGMTGLWQVSGRNDVDYDTRVYFDSWYVKNWSLWVDVAILFKTISAIKGRAGAY